MKYAQQGEEKVSSSLLQERLNPIVVAHDGEEVLAWISRREAGEALPLLVLLGFKLLRIDDLEVLRQYRKAYICRALPVVVLTSLKADEDIEAAYCDPVNSYSVKPDDFDKFMDVAAQIELYWCLLNQPPR